MIRRPVAHDYFLFPLFSFSYLQHFLKLCTIKVSGTEFDVHNAPGRVISGVSSKSKSRTLGRIVDLITENGAYRDSVSSVFYFCLLVLRLRLSDCLFYGMFGIDQASK